MSLLAGVRQFLSGARKDADSKPPYLLSLRSSTLLIVLTVNLAIFTDIFYYALIVPVIPFSLTVQVGIPEDEVQHWTSLLLAFYSVALFVGSPIAGLYADHTSSRRWPLLIGLVTLAASTLLLCFGNTIGLLALGRVLQGLSAAVVWSVGCALLVDTMDSAGVGVAMGYVNISMSVGLLIAPVIGGSVYHAAGYYPVYYIAFGVVAVDIILRLFMIEKKVARQWIPEEPTTAQREDISCNIEKGLERTARGEGLADDAPGSATLFTDGGLRATPDQPEDIGPALSPQERTFSPSPVHKASKTRPMMTLLKSPRLLAALYGIVVEAGIMMGFDAVLALFVHDTFNWDSTAAGILFLAVFVPGFVSPAVGWLADKYGAKYPSFGGFTATVPLLVCLRFVSENTVQHKILLCFLLALLGTSLAFSNTPLMAEISYVIEEKDAECPGVFGEKGVYGLGYGLFTMAFALGGTVGPLWAGYVLASAGWKTMTWSFAIWAASGGIIVLIGLGGKVKKPEEATEGLGDEQGTSLGD
ncbi:MFS general substrate transporter [Xylariomycetidae sp. FL0641]|nr:MFS general substrate transporter [Xylariomycetidae sp. FL0641]